mmetsp:Transcript_53883/g.143422  ORF Transcript_53883/g.143422 Transcript_53883/m.143422 type:complete len:101 (+) Transcript_53883:93-395(+)
MRVAAFVIAASASPALLGVGESSCAATDMQHRVGVQNRLAGLCEDMCKATGAYPNCGGCPSFVAPDSTPGVMTWDELLVHLGNVKNWGRDMVIEWNKKYK